MLDTIFQRHLCDKSNAAHCYTAYYESILNPHPSHLLEIGIFEGASLKSWWEYLPNTEIYGVDDNSRNVLDFLEERILNLPSVHYVFGDSREIETKNKIQQMQPEFDIIIDDGSHYPKDQLETFLNFFPLLKPNGIYVIEDVIPCHLPDHDASSHKNDKRVDEFTKEFYEHIFIPKLQAHGSVSFHDFREESKVNQKRYGINSYILQIVNV